MKLSRCMSFGLTIYWLGNNKMKLSRCLSFGLTIYELYVFPRPCFFIFLIFELSFCTSIKIAVYCIRVSSLCVTFLLCARELEICPT